MNSDQEFAGGDDSCGSGDSQRAAFRPTQWSTVLLAQRGDSAASLEALQRLCRLYWPPVYCFVRSHWRCGHHDAQDLTQILFAHIFEKNTLRKAARENGKFRTFLLAILEKVSANEWKKGQAQKRGGGCTLIPIDQAAAEKSYQSEPSVNETPDKAFDRRWAAIVIQRAMERLRNEYLETNKLDLFDALESHLAEDPDTATYEGIADKFRMSRTAVKTAAFRFRRQFRKLLRGELSETVSTVAEVDGELRHLMAAVSD